MIKIVMADDHTLLRSALANLINTFENCQVIYQAENGGQLIELLSSREKPDILLLDLNMPVKDGYETAKWVNAHFPAIHIIMLTMYDSELTLIRLLNVGVAGFIKKDISPLELKKALYSIYECGYYYSAHTADKLAGMFRKSLKNDNAIIRNTLDEKEIEFLRLICSDATYKEIAMHMELTPRNIDVLRDQLFVKLNVKSRVGLAMLAIRNGIMNGF